MYYSFLLIIRHDQFLDNRVLGIGTTLIIIGVLNWFGQKENEHFLNSTEKYILLFFGLSTLVNLPKEFIWESILSVFV